MPDKVSGPFHSHWMSIISGIHDQTCKLGITVHQEVVVVVVVVVVVSLHLTNVRGRNDVCIDDVTMHVYIYMTNIR